MHHPSLIPVGQFFDTRTTPTPWDEDVKLAADAVAAAESVGHIF